MTYIPDLAPVSYVGLEGPVRAVGWLESSQPFTRGPVEHGFAQRLMALIERPIWRYLFFGVYWCSHCAAEGRSGPDYRTSQAVLLVPAANCVYETPIWIGHYVLGHSYQPPAEFCRAVMSCPEPGSEEFRRALIAHLPRLSDLDSQADIPLFVDYRDSARRTLEPDPERGSKRQFLEREARRAKRTPSRQVTRDEWIAKHGGLSTTVCAWAGCENLALADMAICVDHAYRSKY